MMVSSFNQCRSGTSSSKPHEQIDGTAHVYESWLKQGVTHLDGSLFEKTVVMIDSPNMTAELDDPSDVSDEGYDSM